MKNRMLASVFCVAVAMAMSGCLMANMGTLQDSTKPVLQSRYSVLGDRVSGTDVMWILPFGITVGKPGSPALRALDVAMAQSSGADALVEVSQNVETYVYPIPIFPIMQVITRVSGTPVKLAVPR